MTWLTTTRVGLVCCIVAGVALAAAGNLAVDLGDWGDGGSERVPAGWEWVDQVVGYVWLVLFGVMAAASWLANSSGRPTATRDGRIILGLMLVCILYPVYTLGFQAIAGLIANVIVLVLFVIAATEVRRSSPVAAVLLLPVVAWIAIATVYVVKLVALNA